MSEILYNIDIAAVSDVEAVAEAEAQSFTDPWSLSGIAHFCDCESAFVICAKDEDGKLAGYAVGSFAAGEGELLRIAVLPSYRREGLGRAILKNFLSQMTARKVTTVFLEVRASNAGAIALYGGEGFERYAVRRNYYKDPVEDALMLRFDLVDRLNYSGLCR